MKSFLLLVLTACVLTSTNAFCVSTRQILRRTIRLDTTTSSIEQFNGPAIGDVSVLCSLELEELGLVLSVAKSTVAAGSLGLFCRISNLVDETSLPAMTLLAGYAKGQFQDQDQGDKTVGFSIMSMNAPVFFNRQLMTIEKALTCVATETEAVSLAGHDVCYDEEAEKIVVVPTNEPPFARYFVPNDGEEMNITNFGQYCNDRAFVSGIGPDEYRSRCETENCIRLVWRLEYDKDAKMLKPSWPVSVLARDMKFCNREPIELGTMYGWNYWNATIELERM